MRVIRTVSASRRLLSLAFIGLLATACSARGPTLSRPSAETSPGSQGAETVSGEFTVAASMNDTWNTVGQILVRTDGVIYESRAQMLGIYGLRYRGERFLIRTQALVLQSPADGIVTRVLALGVDGKPRHSAAAIELLEILKKRVPQEIKKYSLPMQLKDKPKARKPKKGSH